MCGLFNKGSNAASSGSIPATGGSVIGSTTINWEDQFKQNNVMWKVPRNIRLNDNIVVREDEIAVFYRDGKVLTYFDQPNRYALTDFNAPIVGNLLKFFTGVQQQAEVYYLQKRFLDGKFGSTQPYQFTDPTFGIVNLRVFGEYRWRVSSPENFINQFVGTFSVETSDDVESRLKEQMVILVYNAMGKMKAQGLKVTDLAANLTTIEQAVLALSPDNFGQYGVEINKISGLTISLPDEVQKAIDTRSQIQVLGVNYMQYQAGQAMVDAAKNPSGTAGVGAGLGVGIGAGAGMGYAFGGQMMQGMAGGMQPSRSCPNCGSLIAASSTFCPNCGASLQQPPAQAKAQTCAQCGSPLQAGAKFCPNCGAAVAQPAVAAPAQTKTCPSCGAVVTGSPKFCPQCGKAM
ncbi:MAG: SPFH domain-containing protein [Nitrososphaerales archaeon]|jgi:membrane protease subunit (stomatin/prohibitin family)